MSKSLIVKNSLHIDATPEKVWDALVNPEQTKKYMFGCAALSDWTVGSSLIWKGVFEGKELVAVTGKITEIQENKFLAYTVFDPNQGWEDIPENYTTVTYSLVPDGAGTLFTVTQGDFANVINGEARYKEVYNNGDGWMPIMVQIKALVE